LGDVPERNPVITAFRENLQHPGEQVVGVAPQGERFAVYLALQVLARAVGLTQQPGELPGVASRERLEGLKAGLARGPGFTEEKRLRLAGQNLGPFLLGTDAVAVVEGSQLQVGIVHRQGVDLLAGLLPLASEG